MPHESYRIMCAQLRYYFKINPDSLEEEEVIKLHADLQYVRKLELELQQQIPGFSDT